MLVSISILDCRVILGRGKKITAKRIKGLRKLRYFGTSSECLHVDVHNATVFQSTWKTNDESNG